MKKLYLIQLLLFISVVAHAQPYETNPDFNRTRNWHFGYGVGLRFDPDTIYEVPTGIETQESATVHTDQYGNLLLYSNGEKIWNADHQIINNGELTLGHRHSSLGSLFVVHKDNPDSIYLFYTNYNLSTTKELAFSLIVKEIDSFRVAFKDSILQLNMCGALALTQADKNNDLWIIGHALGKNQLISFRLTNTGLIKCPVISLTKSTPTGAHGAFLSMTYSGDGKYFVKTNTNQPPPLINKGIEIYKFDINNGLFEYLYSIDDTLSPRYRGVCFSKNNENLFVSDRDNGVVVYKFNPTDSLETVSNIKTFMLQGLSFSLQKLPYNEDVALVRLDTFPYMDLFLNSYNIDSIELVEKRMRLNYSNYVGVNYPNFNQSYYYTPSINFTVKLNCVTNTIQFYGKDTFQANTHNWEITKQGITMTENIKNPLIEFTDTGVYNVRYIASNGSRSDTVSKEVTMLPKIQKDFLGNDTGWCNAIGSPLALQAPNGMHCYEWNIGETTQQITVDTTGIYIAKITTPNFCVIYDTVIISIDTLPNIETDFLGDNVSWCENLDSSVTLAAPANMQQYLWSTGETTQQIEVDTAGVYWVQVSARNQCETGGNLVITDTIVISFDTVPNAPTIYRDNDTLKTNALADYYQWFKDEQEIGSNEPQLIITDTGVYKLKITNFFGCTAYSDTIQITEKDTLIDNVNIVTFEGTKVYPNPFNNSLVIERVNLEEIHLSIYSIEGKVILNKRLENNLDLIITDKWVAGIYLIKLTSTNGQIRTYKFIKI